MFFPGPMVYMDEHRGRPRQKGMIDLDAPVDRNLTRVAKAKGSDVNDLTVMILDRPRNPPYIDAVRRAGARIRLIRDGDVSGAIATARPDSGIDMLLGIGGTPEGVLAAAAMRCMGGEIQGRLGHEGGGSGEGDRGGLRPRTGTRDPGSGGGHQRLVRRDRDHRR